MKRDDDLVAMKAKLRALAGKGVSKKNREEPETSIKKVKRSRKRKDSKRKGNKYENKIAKMFADWSGEEVRRTPGSGGWSKAAFGVTGDLVCDVDAFPFHVECKKREGWYLEDLITDTRVRDSRSVIEWWRQTVKTCPKKKVPLLVFAHNGRHDLAMLKMTDFYAVAKHDFTAEFLPMFMMNTDEWGNVMILSLHMLLAKTRPPKGCRGRKKWKFKAKNLLPANIDE